MSSRRWTQSILKEINPEYSLEGRLLKLKLQYFGHLMWRAKTLEKTLMLGKTEGRRRWQRMRWHHQLNECGFKQTPRDSGGHSRAWHSAVHEVKKSQTWLSNWTTTTRMDELCRHPIQMGTHSTGRTVEAWEGAFELGQVAQGEGGFMVRGPHWMHWRKQGKAREDQLQTESKLTDHPRAERSGAAGQRWAAAGRNTTQGRCPPQCWSQRTLHQHHWRKNEWMVLFISSGRCWCQHWVTGRTRVPWSRKWQPTPAFLPGESQGQRSLAGCSPRGCKDSDLTDGLSTQAAQHTLEYPKDASKSFPAGPVNCNQRFCRKWVFHCLLFIPQWSYN